MARLLFIFIFLFVTSCAYIPQESPQLPEKFLGLWHPYSDDLFQNAVVDASGTILFPSTHKRFEINDIWTYKTIMIEGDNAYLLVKQEDSPKTLKIFPELINPIYEYVRLEYKNPEYQITKLCIAIYSYSLKEKDWNLPVSVHKKRIKSIPDYTEARSGRDCYSR